VERDWDKTESLLPLVSRLGRAHDETFFSSDFQNLGKDKPKDEGIINNQNWSESEIRPRRDCFKISMYLKSVTFSA
jgi:hypothetical protein